MNRGERAPLIRIGVTAKSCESSLKNAVTFGSGYKDRMKRAAEIIRMRVQNVQRSLGGLSQRWCAVRTRKSRRNRLTLGGTVHLLTPARCSPARG
jgi:hypothetical protein